MENASCCTASRGLGDSLQFLRYVRWWRRQAAVWCCRFPLSLRRLAKSLPGSARDRCDRAAVAGLCVALPADEFAAGLRHHAHEHSRAGVVSHGVGGGAGQGAGISLALARGTGWAGLGRGSEAWQRSLSLAGACRRWSRSCEPKGHTFFRCNWGRAVAQLASLTLAEGKVTSLAPGIADLEDTAALIEELDLVIAVDTGGGAFDRSAGQAVVAAASGQRRLALVDGAGG